MQSPNDEMPILIPRGPSFSKYWAAFTPSARNWRKVDYDYELLAFGGPVGIMSG